MQTISLDSDKPKNTNVLFTASQLKSSQILAGTQHNAAAQRQNAVLEQSLQESMSLPADASYADRIRIGKKAAQNMQLEGKRSVQENAEEYLDTLKEFIEEKAQEAQKEHSHSKEPQNAEENTAAEENTQNSQTETVPEPQQTQPAQDTAPQTDTSDTADNTEQQTTVKFTKRIDVIV